VTQHLLTFCGDVQNSCNSRNTKGA